tara:strand:- start:104 stop:397 length:294 start_codon:yes stop_codon:yes gene_type:complete
MILKLTFQPIVVLTLLLSLANQTYSKPLLTQNDLIWMSHKQVHENLSHTQYELSQLLYHSSRLALLNMSIKDEILNKINNHKKRSPKTPFKYRIVSD